MNLNKCHRTSLINISLDLNKRKLHHRFFVTHKNNHILKRLLVSNDGLLFIKERSMQDTAKSFDRKDLKANARTNYYEFYVNT